MFFSLLFYLSPALTLIIYSLVHFLFYFPRYLVFHLSILVTLILYYCLALIGEKNTALNQKIYNLNSVVNKDGCWLREMRVLFEILYL